MTLRLLIAALFFYGGSGLVAFRLWRHLQRIGARQAARGVRRVLTPTFLLAACVGYVLVQGSFSHAYFAQVGAASTVGAWPVFVGLAVAVAGCYLLGVAGFVDWAIRTDRTAIAYERIVTPSWPEWNLPPLPDALPAIGWALLGWRCVLAAALSVPEWVPAATATP